MKGFLFSVRRFLRRLGSILMIVVVLSMMAIGWISDRCSSAVHAIIFALGFKRFEEWLKSFHVWITVPVIVVMWVLSHVLGIYTTKLIFFDARYVYGVFLWVVNHVVFIAFLNYTVRLYGEQYLRIRWIASCYQKWQSYRAWGLELLHKQPWYQRAHELKVWALAHIKERWGAVRHWFARYSNRRTLLAIARRVVRRWRHV